jgi:heat shock protein HtpX
VTAVTETPPAAAREAGRPEPAAPPVIPVDFYTRQERNRRRTLLLVLGFLAFFLVLGLGIDAVWGGFLTPGGDPIPVVTLVTSVLAVTMSFTSYYGGARLVMASLHASPLSRENPQHRQLFNIVTEMALASGLPQPEVYVIPDPAPNALATGRDPQHAVLAVTQGLLNVLDREEMQGVVAHEMSHIGNRDTLTMTVVAVLFGGAVMLADWARRALYFGRDRRRGSPLMFLVVVLLLAVTPLLSRILAMAVSRQREYLADATAAQFTRNPLGLASALEKIGAATSPLQAATQGTAHLFISNPLRRNVDDRQGALADLLSTHPPLAQRIAILRAMAHAS